MEPRTTGRWRCRHADVSSRDSSDACIYISLSSGKFQFAQKLGDQALGVPIADNFASNSSKIAGLQAEME